MLKQPIDPWQIGIVVALAAASLAMWAFVVLHWHKRGAILPYEPRRPVPWGPWAVMLAALLVADTVLAAFNPDVRAEVDAQVSGPDVVDRLVLGMSFPIMIVGLALLATIVVSRAGWTDLGLPISGRQACRDAALGVLLCLAAYLPVFGVQRLITPHDAAPEHPMIRMVLQTPEPLIYVLSGLFAVVVAPLCEELIFRLLLQGSLEKWEDDVLIRTALSRDRDVQAAGDIDNANCAFDANDEQDGMVHHAAARRERPIRSGWRFFPHGWVPVLVSSTLFSLAHLGHGTDPIPLFVLALFFGIAYQRTHRILPSIVAHAMFNMISMVILWRVVVTAEI